MNYELIEIVQDNDNLRQYNRYGDSLKNQDCTKEDTSPHVPETSLKDCKSERFEDDILYCFECDDEYVGECKDHKSQWILNKRVICSHTSQRANIIFNDYYNENLDVSECFCKANGVKHIKTTLPNGFFLIKSKIENTTYGVWTRNFIYRGTILGPFLGKLTRENMIGGVSSSNIEEGVNDFVWSLIQTNNVGSCNLIDGRDCMVANYLRFIRRARTEEEQNLSPIQFDGKIFYQATKDIEFNKELLISYNVRIFQPPHCQDSISIRLIPSLGLFDKERTRDKSPTLDSSFVTDSKTNVTKSNTLSPEYLETIKPCPSLSNTEDQSDCDSHVTDSKSLKSTLLEDFAQYIPTYRCGGPLTKSDDEMKNFLRELFLKYPTISGVQANKAMRQAMPHKPIISDRTILTIIKKYGFRQMLDLGDSVDKLQVQTVIQLSSENRHLTAKNAQRRLREIFPDKQSLSLETINKIIGNNRRPTFPRKVDKAMHEFLAKTLKKQPEISSKRLNDSMQKAFPNKPKISSKYLNKIVSRRQLRPSMKIQRKVDDSMQKLIVDLYFKESFTCAEICHVLNQKYSGLSITERCVNRVISLQRASLNSDNSD